MLPHIVQNHLPLLLGLKPCLANVFGFLSHLPVEGCAHGVGTALAGAVRLCTSSRLHQLLNGRARIAGVLVLERLRKFGERCPLDSLYLAEDEQRVEGKLPLPALLRGNDGFYEIRESAGRASMETTTAAAVLRR